MTPTEKPEMVEEMAEELYVSLETPGRDYIHSEDRSADQDRIAAALRSYGDLRERAAVQKAASIVRLFLAYDSQRAVSWHEIQDCLEAIDRAFPQHLPTPSAEEGK